MRNLTIETFLAVVVTAGAAIGLGLILAPTSLLWLFGLDIDRPASFVARELGAALLGLSTIFWAAQDPWDLGRQVLLGGLVFNSFGLVAALGAVWSGVLSGGGWFLVALHFVLAGGFAYFRHAR